MYQLTEPLEEPTQFWADTNIDQLLRQLERIDLLLQSWAGQVLQQQNNPALDTFILTAEELEARIIAPQGVPHWCTPCKPWESSASTTSTKSYQCYLLDKLAARFDLTEFEKDVLLLGLLPYFDSRYFILFAALHGTPQKKWLSFELALTLFCSSPQEKIVQEVSFLPQSPLLGFQLLNLGKKGEQQGEGWNQTLFQTDIGVYHYLTGQRHLPALLMNCTEWLSPETSHIRTVPPAIMAALQAQTLSGSDEIQPVLMVRGATDTGRAMAITAAALAVGRETLQLDMARLPENDKDAQYLLTQVLRETRMHAACLVVRSLDNLTEERKSLLTGFAQLLNQPGLLVVCLCDVHGPMIWLSLVQQVVVDMPVLELAEKEALLRGYLDPLTATGLNVKAFCERQHFTPHTLPQVLKEAAHYRMLRDPDSPLSDADLRKAFRLRSQQNFGKLARRSEPKRTFDDLIVGEELHQQLTEILVATKHRSFVLEQGFGAKVGYGTGISALFYGDSGTGKTMAAEVIAGQLGVDLIQIDLATVVSKYIGETEKNLSLIFDRAEADAGVLFFDEADALFGKRSAVKDAKDRHANIEVSYLLQRLESYPGLVILATNNRSHLDDAFSRRFTFITRFAFPDVSQRERMWRSIWPGKISIAEEVDFKQLAMRTELTGANIRNIALLATWLATDECTPCVCNQHIERAMKRELAKIGRLAP
ncbi:ATPases of the AAA+ class [Pseudomonas sp. LAMO17WK12:I10]|uniref:ATP-binding protein n=1 Tax=unclassified Pseudomonas TaxID=196821 RepID=UPI000BC3A4D2|nr:MULTISPECIES: AAA family ATPase [unclassified Pseudomonas]PXX59079.1 ATPase family protein associated with various cellular activities (AAA) [Pseudomonas sp. LAMO17WK12:I9]SNY48390.1 ATPases of the AAA+ class [Pseudomonas sp. LAMO17WK12:I10]